MDMSLSYIIILIFGKIILKKRIVCHYALHRITNPVVLAMSFCLSVRMSAENLECRFLGFLRSRSLFQQGSTLTIFLSTILQP